jgi:hypothetical protein
MAKWEIKLGGLMRDFLKIAAGLFKTPWMYVYSLIAIVGTVAAHRNTGLNGSPLLGATGIASSILGIGLFYWQLAKQRHPGLPGRRSGLGLFLSVMAFRIRLLLLLSPFVALLYFLGYFSRMTDGFLQVSIAPAEEKFSLFAHFLLGMWPVALVAVAFSLLDLTGKSVVVAKGFSDHALKHSVKTLKALWAPILLLTAIGLFQAVGGEYFSGFDNWRPWENSITLRLLYDCVNAPVTYLMEMSGILFLAQRIRARLPELLGPARQ